MGQLTKDEVLKYVQLVFRSCSNAIKQRKLLKQMEFRMGKKGQQHLHQNINIYEFQ